MRGGGGSPAAGSDVGAGYGHITMEARDETGRFAVGSDPHSELAIVPHVARAAAGEGDSLGVSMRAYNRALGEVEDVDDALTAEGLCKRFAVSWPTLLRCAHAPDPWHALTQATKSRTRELTDEQVDHALWTVAAHLGVRDVEDLPSTMPVASS